MGFDIGMLISNYLMAYFSQPGHRDSEKLLEYQNWILKVIEETFKTFQQEFKKHEIGNPLFVPPFDKTGVAGINQILLI